MTQYDVWGITHLNQTSHWMKLKQSECLFSPARCLELKRYTIIIHTGGPHGQTPNMGWPRDCASIILLCSIGGSPETAQPRTVPCSQAVSEVISDVRTGLRVRHLLFPSRIPNKTAAKRTCRSELNWLPIIKRRDLALLKITHKALYDDFWPDYLRLKFHIVSAYNLRSLEAPLFQLKAVLFRTQQRDFLIRCLIG